VYYYTVDEAKLLKNSKLLSPAHVQEDKAAVEDDEMFADMLGMFSQTMKCLHIMC
jgi:hypothetical protein